MSVSEQHVMAAGGPTRGDHSIALRWTAWGLFLLWAAFWMFFNVASGISEVAELGPMGLISHLAMPALILACGYLAWRSPLAGGVALIACVALFSAWFGFRGWLLVALLQAPPLIVGLLFVVRALRSGR